MRGTGDSDGLYDDEYSETELADAEAVIGWIAEQPWCSGAVGMMGISWGGFNALQVAARRPPALKAVISIASSVDRYNDDIHYRNGCHLGAHLGWATTMLGYIARPPDSDIVGDRWREMWLERLDAIEPASFTWMAHQRRDDFWKRGSIGDDFERGPDPGVDDRRMGRRLPQHAGQSSHRIRWIEQGDVRPVDPQLPALRISRDHGSTSTRRRSAGGIDGCAACPTMPMSYPSNARSSPKPCGPRNASNASTAVGSHAISAATTPRVRLHLTADRTLVVDIGRRR